jgi:hypothetical protein
MEGPTPVSSLIHALWVKPPEQKIFFVLKLYCIVNVYIYIFNLTLKILETLRIMYFLFYKNIKIKSLYYNRILNQYGYLINFLYENITYNNLKLNKYNNETFNEVIPEKDEKELLQNMKSNKEKLNPY